REFYKLLTKTFQNVSLEYEFALQKEAESIKLYFSRINKNEWLPADDCGLGLQDLLVIIYFAVSNKHNLVLLEEPENHLHPELQRRLLKFLKEDTNENKQYLISTHSSVFLD